MELFLESTGFGLVVASILAISSVGFTLQWGVGKFINLAYVGFMGLAAYLDHTFSQTLEITQREYGFAVKRVPALGPDIAIAVLRSET